MTEFAGGRCARPARESRGFQAVRSPAAPSRCSAPGPGITADIRREACNLGGRSRRGGCFRVMRRSFSFSRARPRRCDQSEPCRADQKNGRRLARVSGFPWLGGRGLSREGGYRVTRSRERAHEKLGGDDNISEGERSLIRRAATLELHCELMEKRFAETGWQATSRQLADYQCAAGALRRITPTRYLARCIWLRACRSSYNRIAITRGLARASTISPKNSAVVVDGGHEAQIQGCRRRCACAAGS